MDSYLNSCVQFYSGRYDYMLTLNYVSTHCKFVCLISVCKLQILSPIKISRTFLSHFQVKMGYFASFKVFSGAIASGVVGTLILKKFFEDEEKRRADARNLAAIRVFIEDYYTMKYGGAEST